MTDELELATSIDAGRLDLLCPRMQLVECPGYIEVVLEGTGVIRAARRGSISFEMVAPVEGVPHPVLRPNRPHGEVHEPHEHVMLIAEDYRGREWRSEWLLPRLIHPASGSPNWVVRHDLSQLLTARTRPLSEQSEGRIYIPRQRHLPFDKTTQTTKTVDGTQIERGWSSDHHVRTIGAGEVEFRGKSDNWLQVTIRQKTPVMPDWAGLMCQALSFATARTVRPTLAAREWNDHVSLGVFSNAYIEYHSYLPPPLIELPSKIASDFWMLVGLFVEWSTVNSEATSLFEELDGIRSGSAGSIQTACLTLAVGIESLANLLLKDEVVPKDAKKEADIERVFKHVQAWEGNDTVRDRALGSLAPLKGIQAADRLYAFATRTNTPAELVTAWRTLRNRRAHGDSTVPDQKLYDLYYSCVELLYRLVCSTIGYDGPIARTSERGWGLGEYH